MANDGKRFIKGSGIAKHREWRGLKDTFYDYTQWVVNLGLLVQFVAKSPVRIMRGMLEYRWLGSYLGSLNMVDKCMAGMRGPALRVSHTQMHAIMKGATQMIADSMKGDRRFGDTKFADKFVMLEQTMCPEIIAGFPNLKALPLEVLQGLLGTYRIRVWHRFTWTSWKTLVCLPTPAVSARTPPVLRSTTITPRSARASSRTICPATPRP